MVIWNEIKGLLGGLGAPVGSGRESRPEDVVKVKRGMRELGRYPRFNRDVSRRIAADTRIMRFCPLFRAAILEPPPPPER